MFNGTEGRLELEVVERAWTPPQAAIDPSRRRQGRTPPAPRRAARPAPALERAGGDRHPAGAGGHGGGDALLLNDVFRGAGEDPLGRQAGHRAGVASVMVGVSANLSAAPAHPSSSTTTAPGPRTETR